MVYRCCVLDCSKTFDNGDQLHSFPFDNQTLLPIWIMATNRINWFPDITSRICDGHFNIDDYEDGNKNNNLITIACPLLNNPSNSAGNDIVMTGSEDSAIKMSTTNDINFSFPHTDDSIVIVSSVDRVRLQTKIINNDKLKKLKGKNSCLLLNTEPLYSTIKSFKNIHWVSNHKCAVLLCNQRFRLKFNELFYIDFPKNKNVRRAWWKTCRRDDMFDPSFKICSIHFKISDFMTVTLKQVNRISKQTVIKNIDIVPTRYLFRHQYPQYINKQKIAVNNTSILSSEKKSQINIPKL